MYTHSRFLELESSGRVYWPRGGDGRPRLKRYESEVRGLTPSSLWTAADVGDNSSAKKELLSEFPHLLPFDTPKPRKLMRRIVEIATNEGEWVLDCFLGSGTTAVVASELGRRWIGVELNEATVRDFAAPRIEQSLARGLLLRPQEEQAEHLLGPWAVLETPSNVA